MAKSYSVDLREKVMKALSDLSVREVAKIFSITRRVIYHWINLRKKTQSLKPKVGYQKGHSHKITDWDEFRKFADTNKHSTVREMIPAWEKENNDTISSSVIERGLKKIGYSSKKNIWLHRDKR